MNRLIIVLLVFLFVSGKLAGQPQPNIDSLIRVTSQLEDSEEKVKNLARLFNAFLYNDPLEAKMYALDEIALSQRINYRDGQATGYYHLGVYYNNTDQQDSARYFYLRSREIYQQDGRIEKLFGVNHAMAILAYSSGDYDEAINILKSNISINMEPEYDTLIPDKEYNLALAHDLLGMVYLFQGNHNLALQEALKALKFFEYLDKPVRKADALNHLSNIEFYLHNFQNAINYNLQALEVYRQYNDKFYESQVLNDIGNNYYYLHKLDSAIFYLEQSLMLAREMDSKDLAGTALNNLGKIYKELGQYEKSIGLSSESLALHESTGSRNKIVEALNDLGMVSNAQKNPQTAIDYFNRSITLGESIGVKENIKIAYFNRSKSHEMLGNAGKALEDYKTYKAIDDSILNETKTRQIEELRTIFDMENKEKEIALQKIEIGLLEANNKVNRLQRILLSAGLGLSVLVLFLIYYGMRQKIKRNKTEKKKIEAELAYKAKQLTTHALHLANKNELLESLKFQLEQLKLNGKAHAEYTKMANTIKFNLQDEKSWANFSRFFDEVHQGFNEAVKKNYPDVSPNELRLMALLKMNLTSKEIASILNISHDGIKKARYRLRKKLNISSDESLSDLIISI
jgi:tetratricopeptide (TPR) repeat protein